MTWVPRIAAERDVPALEELIPLSVYALQASYYTRAQMDAALGPVFGVDRQLIADRTYFVIEHERRILGCGGWSKRRSLFGGDSGRREADPELDPARDAARVRAFFVHPDWARRGVGGALLETCEKAIRSAKFTRIELVATLAGEPLYARFGYEVVGRYEVPMRDGITLPVVKMAKRC
jgi:GNAT superfamily N-acetyltransferase